jgi:hypothetical protein
MSENYGLASIQQNYNPQIAVDFAARINRNITTAETDNTSVGVKTDVARQEADKLAAKSEAELTLQEQAKVQQLKQRDLEVKAHEQAHLNAAGSLAVSGASFTYTTGPNGVRYATGGEVSIDTSQVANDPAATIRKADIIRRAALAPMNPSPQDYSVASQATEMAAQARSELIQEQSLSSNKDNEKSSDEPEAADNDNDVSDNGEPIENTETLKATIDVNV